MPNYCGYDMKVIGVKEKVEEFIKVLKADYSYSNNNFSFDRHMFRVFDAAVYDEEINDDNYIAYINGNCAWSVATCMFENGYYKDVKERFPDIFRGTTVVDESKKLQLKIEIFSEECGMCFQEHYLIDNGNIKIDESVDWQEYYLGDYKTKSEAEKDLETTITDEEWKEHKTDYIERGGFEWDYSI